MRDEPILAPPSRVLLCLFERYLHWYIGRHFHAMRLANGGRFPRHGGPVIVYGNHASWWDPLAFIVISRYFLPTGAHYAPMDGLALKHYGFLGKLGMFPVEAGTRRGAAQFLKAANQIFSTPDSVLWLTPEGRFSDVRTRPLVFRSGLAALGARFGACTLVPLAAEYTFWDERLPEILLCCGQPIEAGGDGQPHSSEEWNERLAGALANTQDELAGLAKLRDGTRFETVLSGRVGVSGVYEGWKRLLSAVTGRAYQGSHGSIHRS
ncbi:MAG: lysophospholipid acyltransferase family protein [Acidobacteriaceae bacterium]